MRIKRILALSTAFVIGFSGLQTASAQEMSNGSESEYLEYHYQVNFDDLDVFVLSGTTLDIASNGNRKMDAETVEAINAFVASLSESSDVEAEIIATLNDNQQLAAISFTEAPLLFVDDHYERVMAAAASTYASSDDSKKGKFKLYTSVSRSFSAKENGKYTYTTKTFGSWSENSFVGGEDYPDSGEDYILQSTPNTWTRMSHSMTARYDNTPFTGVEGDDFWAEGGGANYLQYAIEDDPYEFAKARQNKSFTLTCESEGDASASARIIHSRYVHTWKSLSIAISVSVDSSKEVVLEITPSSTENNWPLYNYITFDF